MTRSQEWLGYYRKIKGCNWVGTWFEVRGEWLMGLIVDPGASFSLIGMQTLGNLRDCVLWPNNRDYEVNHNTVQRVSGIDGVSSDCHGVATIPLGLGPVEFIWTANIMRTNTGYHCPGLLGNEVLQANNVSIHWGWYANGDALMVWPDKTDTSKTHGIRLYLSDGGHLILRVDRYPEK